MSKKPGVLKMYEAFASKPMGKALFSKAVTLKAPYFRSISPKVEVLEPGRCEVTAKKRWGVTNHIGTFHAIAMCNMAELAAGLMTDVSIPTDMRWIPKGMTVEYLKKAETDLRAIATPGIEVESGQSVELPVNVEVKDKNDVTVFRATISMWVTPKK